MPWMIIFHDSFFRDLVLLRLDGHRRRRPSLGHAVLGCSVLREPLFCSLHVFFREMLDHADPEMNHGRLRYDPFFDVLTDRFCRHSELPRSVDDGGVSLAVENNHAAPLWK